MPNPNRDPETQQFTSPPEQPQQEDPWAAVRAAGVSPEDALRGAEVWRGLNHLDTRKQTLEGLLRPDIDTWIAQQPQAEQESPFAQYGQPEPEEEEYYAPPQPQVDLRSFAEEVYSKARDGVVTWADIERMQQEQAREEAFNQAARAATEHHKLPGFMSADIEQQAKFLAAQQPNRPPGDIANELAAQRRQELDSYYQAQNPSLPGPSVPGGPTPSGGFQQPTNDQEAMDASRMGLDP